MTGRPIPNVTICQDLAYGFAQASGTNQLDQSWPHPVLVGSTTVSGVRLGAVLAPNPYPLPIRTRVPLGGLVLRPGGDPGAIPCPSGHARRVSEVGS